MKSLLIEFHRFKNLGSGILRQGDDYLVVVADHPGQQVQMTIDQIPFLREMRNLRYKAGTEARELSLRKIGDVVTNMLGARIPELETGEFPVQLDLVVNARELAALPFEMVTDSEGRSLLVRNGRPIELTRRVRHDFAETAVRWPSRPRVLYIWACPPGAGVEVPYREHEERLRAAVKPWMPVDADTGEALTVLPRASLSAIQAICASPAARKKPFTHVHILAHGCSIGDDFEKHFGIALHDECGEFAAVEPEDFTKALAPLSGEAVVVTLATCDSANTTNTLSPEKSIAHDLHESGFPVVLASQLPLTVPGSTILVERFYGALFAGRDVRTALHEARMALYENRGPAGHDWASLVGYVRLPEGYADYLQEVRLDAVMVSLKIARDRSTAGADLAQVDEIAGLLRQHIQALEAFLPETEKHPREAVLQENLGLLGSAQKRLADLLFQRGKLSPDDDWRTPMREALTSAREWYRRGYERNLSHHWTGVQYLALDAVLDGKISHPSYWYAAVAAAEIQARGEKEFWAYGSLAELYLLAPLVSPTPLLEKATDALKAMRERVIQYNKSDPFPLESTRCQLCRYKDWWTAANGFFPGRPDLAAEAERLIEGVSG